MCGISGALSVRDDTRTGRAAVHLAQGLTHRGPDGVGFWSLSGDGVQREGSIAVEQDAATIALGHRRLSIVDLEGGAQPMSSADRDVWISFNGEIYNHLELRRELERAGHRFRTRCDTEVLVHGWQAWGTELFERLNGMFAVAVVDVPNRRVILARDPLGVKPLYLGRNGGMTWWSSELGAALQAGLVEKELSADAVRLLLTFRFVPSPHSIYDDVRKVPPGHYVCLTTRDAGRDLEFNRYTSRIRYSAQPKSEADWAMAISEGLRSAVRRQLMSDIPVGTLLSGGVDSTVISRLMVEGLSEPPQAFAIGADSPGLPNETRAATLAAQELGIPLTALQVSDRDLAEGWIDAIAAMSEPIANPGIMLLGELCQSVGRTHKVVLTGQGADEPLGGYPRHVAERLWRVGHFAPRLSGFVAQRIIGGESGDRLSRVLNSDDQVDRIVDILAVFPAAAVDAITSSTGAPTRELAREAVRNWLPAAEDEDSVNTLLRVDARLSLADDLLIVADQLSMRSSVELRVPFLDLEFIELVERMPSRYKISNLGARKWLYRRVARDILPKQSGDRLCGLRARFGRKYGFTVPMTAVSETERAFSAAQAGSNSLAMIAAVLDWPQAFQAKALQSPRQRSVLLSLAVWAGAVTSARAPLVAA
ncbi:MAG: asparagine synthase (glutamine-hydrolyzing) [Gemmatimonadaceae bacterium]